MDILNNNNLNWHTYTDLSDPRYPIDYADAVLSVSEDGRLEIVVKWQPNSFCHFHHHTADASSVILQGELIVIDVDPITGEELGQATRAVGDFRHKGPGDVHREQAGPEGALVLFTIFAPEGKIAEALDEERNVISVSTIPKIIAKRAPSTA